MAKSAPNGSKDVPAGEGCLSHAAALESGPMARIDMCRRGVPAADAKRLLDLPALRRGQLLSTLGLPAAAFGRKVKAGGRLSEAESERVLGFARLVGQVEEMMGREANEAKKHGGRAWFAEWIMAPVPALGMIRPIDLLGTMEGQSIVSIELGQIAAGVYA